MMEDIFYGTVVVVVEAAVVVLPVEPGAAAPAPLNICHQQVYYITPSRSTVKVYPGQSILRPTNWDPLVRTAGIKANTETR